MPKFSTKAMIALAGAAVLAGCTHLSTHTLPKSDIGKYKHIFVESGWRTTSESPRR
jgi:hypothetical protein